MQLARTDYWLAAKQLWLSEPPQNASQLISNRSNAQWNIVWRSQRFNYQLHAVFVFSPKTELNYTTVLPNLRHTSFVNLLDHYFHYLPTPVDVLSRSFSFDLLGWNGYLRCVSAWHSFWYALEKRLSIDYKKWTKIRYLILKKIVKWR